MVINNNLSAMYAQRENKFNHIRLNKDIEKLSSGYRINRGSDDASGLAISEKMRAQVRGLNMAERNAADGISLIQTAEGYLSETHSLLQRIRELAVQAANGTSTQSDKLLIQVEVSQLVDEINRIASNAQFNSMNLFTGRFARAEGQNQVSSSMWLHVGANADQREQLFIGTMTAQALGIQGTNGLPHTATFISLTSQENANNSLVLLDEAISKVSKQRADLGAYQNRLELTREGLSIGSENLLASESRIRDADMAAEAIKFTKDNILVQSSQAMIAQANNIPQQVLQLLK